MRRKVKTGTEGRKMKPWSKPVIRHIGQTIYTATGSETKAGEGEKLHLLACTILARQGRSGSSPLPDG